MSNIFRPCDECSHCGKCKYERGCWQWKTWFRAYWKELRRLYL